MYNRKNKFFTLVFAVLFTSCANDKISELKVTTSSPEALRFFNKAMNYLMDNSTVFFLDVPFDQIIERVKNFSARGFAKSPNQTIKDAFEERKCLYEKYSHHLINNSFDVDSCVKKILELI